MARININMPVDIDICAVDFDADEFRRALIQHGLQLTWDWAVSCPCQQKQSAPGNRTVLTGSNQLRCPGCRGSGLLYVERHTTFGMLIDSISEVKFANIFARYATGSVLITLLPEHVPALNDRLTLNHGVCVYEEVMTHLATTERPRFPIVNRPLWVGIEGQDGEAELKIFNVLYCRAADDNGNLTSTVYESGVDFTVNDNGEIVWITEIPFGTRICVRYYGRPSFVVKGFPHTRRDLYVNNVPDVSSRYLAQHPVRVMCEPEFLGARNPPVVDDVTAPHADIVDPDLP